MQTSSVSAIARRGSAVALLASMMLLASCGSTSGTSSASTDKARSTGNATTTAAGANGDSATPTTESQANKNDPDASSKFCTIAVEAESAMDDAFEAADWDRDGDREELFVEFKRNFSELPDVLDTMVDAAPAEIKSDVKIVRDAFTELRRSLEDKHSFDDMEDMDGSFIDSDEVDEAGGRIEKFLSDECGIEPED